MCNTQDTRSRCFAMLRSRRRSAAGNQRTAWRRVCTHPSRRHCRRGGRRRFRCSARRRWRCRSVAEARRTAGCPWRKRRTDRWQRKQACLAGRCNRCYRHISRIDYPDRGGSAPSSLCLRHRFRVRPRSARSRAHQRLAHRRGQPRAHLGDCPLAHLEYRLRPAHPGSRPLARRAEPKPATRRHPAQGCQARRSPKTAPPPHHLQRYPSGPGCRPGQGYQCHRPQPAHKATQGCTRSRANTAACRWARRYSNLA